MSSPSDLEKSIGYVFRDGGLLAMALTHASARKDDIDNERLEFLGDRVLGLVLADLLYRDYPAESEGSLAKRHAGLVRQEALVAIAQEIDLASFLRLAGGTKNDTVVADALEALIGAIYVDGGFSAAESFVTARWKTLLAEQSAPPEDSKTRLQEWAQERGLPLPEYKTISRSGPDHAPVFEIEVSVQNERPVCAVAASKRAAEKEAAAKLLQQIEGKT